MRLLSPTLGRAREKHMPHSHYTPQHTLCHCTHAEHTESGKQTQRSLLSPSVIWTPSLPIFCLGQPVDGLGEQRVYSPVRFRFLSCFPTHTRNVINNTRVLGIWRMHTHTHTKIHAHADMRTHVNTHTHIQTDLAVPSSSYENYCRWVKSPWPPSHTHTAGLWTHTRFSEHSPEESVSQQGPGTLQPCGQNVTEWCWITTNSHSFLWKNGEPLCNVKPDENTPLAKKCHYCKSSI